ncbi:MULTISPECIES: DUF4352 domain-containing protein [unclassified Arthrobacter]|uniref:DUF4352 domain-containing protein n=1 Tax=unclassified Arthrobacter TaxID=235627 RepID=UPI001C8637E6|nr:DUF4352 domain-containing protein [Arthrobacter sp. MAHUQ-56]MBX7442905.1 DUF4352 domain-containing protein [Arthrobacter sp. MAHUQ-56]
MLHIINSCTRNKREIMSSTARSIVVTAATLTLGSLAGCDGGSNTITPGAEGAPATKSAAPPAPNAEVKLSGSFGDTITFPSGVAVKVAPPAAVPAPQYSAGGVEGKIVTFDLSVTNGGTEPINAGLMGFPKVSYGASGTQAQNATDIQSGIGASSLSTILPGETQSVKLGFGIPAAEFGNVRMEVSGPTFSDKPAIFKGTVR